MLFKGDEGEREEYLPPLLPEGGHDALNTSTPTHHTSLLQTHLGG